MTHPSHAGYRALPPAKDPCERTHGARGHAPPVTRWHEHRGGKAGILKSHPVLATAQGHAI